MAMVAVAATIEELEWKWNETLEIVSCWVKAYGFKLAFSKKLLLLLFKILICKSKVTSK